MVETGAHGRGRGEREGRGVTTEGREHREGRK